MQYCFHLDEESTWYFILVMPFGKYQCKVLPIGLANSPDWAQATMEKLFSDICIENYNNRKHTIQHPYL